jgi:photosystem II stability/assembly factor-like uncharacterized protein
MVRVAAAALVLAAVVAIVWFASRGDGDDATDASGAPSGLAHVHGLGIDPGDGTLYVASHFGVFRVPEAGAAERIGPVQDFMGFTVVGGANFLASGHPGVEGQREGQPANLGLIESTDGAATWQDVSLSGEADFHALEYAHDQVYGWAATSRQFMVSADQTTWDPRSTLELFDFAVDPEDADRVVATTPQGMQASADRGSTWEPVDRAPDLVLVAWDSDSGLWGVDPGGTVFHTTAPDLDWDQAGSLPGPPQALLADDTTVYAAAMEGELPAIYTSTDGGATWQLRYSDNA